MSPQAQQALGNMEDSDKAGYPRPKRTFRQAVRYSIDQGYVWLIWGDDFYRIINGKAIKDNGKS